MTMPGFTSTASLYRSTERYRAAQNRSAGAANGIVPQFLACAVYAGLCLAASEDPPLAGWCWWDFAQRCGGAVA
jgi:hypothetical protein